MKKINQKGFVLAETLVVAVFLMAIFTLIFTNFYPLMGEYEKRESYDDVDGKYSVYWLKRMIEDSSYNLTTKEEEFFNSNSFVRFECKDISDTEKREMCVSLVKALEVKGCNSSGNHCEIYITKYQIGKKVDNDTKIYFKDKVSESILKNQVNKENRDNYINECKGSSTDGIVIQSCTREADKKEFRSGFKDYIESLPDYTADSLTGARYRVIAAFQHKKDNNNYYSYATIEVSR